MKGMCCCCYWHQGLADGTVYCGEKWAWDGRRNDDCAAISMLGAHCMGGGGENESWSWQGWHCMCREGMAEFHHMSHAH